MPEPPLPKLTIATVTYNAGPHLAVTIESIEQQTYPNVEHLIVDGNSQDNTMELVHRYQERNSHAPVPHEITCRSEPDKGLYDAMNKAILLAQGDYLLFLNAGDRLHAPDTLERLARAIGPVARPAVVYGDTDIVDAEGRFLRHRRLQPPARLTWRSFKSGMLVCHQAFLARTDLARAVPYDLQYRYSADFDWCIRLLRLAERERLTTLNAGIIVADYLHEGMTTQHHKASLRERFRIMTRHYGWASTLLHHAWFVARAVVRR